MLLILIWVMSHVQALRRICTSAVMTFGTQEAVPQWISFVIVRFLLKVNNFNYYND